MKTIIHKNVNTSRKKKKVNRYITDDLEISSDDSDEENSTKYF